MRRDIALWACFLFGQGLYILLQMQAIGRAKGLGWRAVASSMGLNLAVRFFLAAMLFWALLTDALAGFFTGRLAAALSRPMTIPVAGMYGFAADAFLGFLIDRYYPSLRKTLPQNGI